MNTLSMSKRWVIAFQAAGVLVALAVVVGVAVLAGSAAPRAATHRPSHPAAQAAMAQTEQHHATFTLPVTVNLSAVLAILCCLLALSAWAAWQRRHRCRDCGYAPVFCRCELAGSGH